MSEDNGYKQAEDGFIAELQRLKGGRLEEELDDALREGIAAAIQHGGTSKITLVLEVKKDPEYEGMVGSKGTFTKKFPELPVRLETRFTTKDNGLSADMPEQEELDLGGMKKTTAPVSQLKRVDNNE